MISMRQCAGAAGPGQAVTVKVTRTGWGQCLYSESVPAVKAARPRSGTVH